MDNYKKYFHKAIRNNFPNRSGKLIASVNSYYERILPGISFLSSTTNPIDKRLDFSAYFLALIKTLDEQGEDFENIKRICLEIVTAYVTPNNKVQETLKRLPAKLIDAWIAKIFLNQFGKKIGRRSHPDGFAAQIITDKNKTFGLGYGLDILEYGICRLFKKHNYQKYSSILCEVDELT